MPTGGKAVYGKVIQGDCLVEMPKLPGKSIDMILCDLPYGTTACKWDTVIPFGPLWAQYERVVKDNGAIVLTASQPFTSALVMSNLAMFKYEWVWDKHIPRGFVNAKVMPMSKHENVLVFGRGKLKYNPEMILRDKPVTVKNYSKRGKDSAYKMNADGGGSKSYTYTHKNPDSIIVGCWEANKGKLHPTQKPLSLFEYLIKTYTDEGDTVLDNCAGSGTTGLACKNLHRNYVLIEKEREYIEIIKKRLSEGSDELALAGTVQRVERQHGLYLAVVCHPVVSAVVRPLPRLHGDGRSL